MRSDRARWLALAAVLGGCSFEWDALRPRVDGGTRADVQMSSDAGSDAGFATDVVTTTDAGEDAGTADVGESDAGELDAGESDAGELDAGTDVGFDAGTDVGFDAGVMDVGTPDVGTPDVGRPDVGTPDVGTPDVGTPDAGTPDTGPACTGSTCACSTAAPTGWCAVGSTCVSGACAAGTVAGSLVITEIMNDLEGSPAEPEGEWIEIYNPGPSAVNLSNVRVRDASSSSGPIVPTSGTAIIQPGAYVVLARTANLDISGGAVRAVATYDTVALNNSGTESVIIETTTGTQIDSVSYGSGWPNVGGHSKSLRSISLDATANNMVANWCGSTTLYTTANYGTPGAANDCP